MPLSAGMRAKNRLKASSPPAEAPMPTTGKTRTAAGSIEVGVLAAAIFAPFATSFFFGARLRIVLARGDVFPDLAGRFFAIAIAPKNRRAVTLRRLCYRKPDVSDTAPRRINAACATDTPLTYWIRVHENPCSNGYSLPHGNIMVTTLLAIPAVRDSEVRVSGLAGTMVGP